MHASPLRSLLRSLLYRAICIPLLLVLAAASCADRKNAEDGPLLVFAASSMRDALTQIAHDHRAAGGDSVVLVFGSTGDLATQIANGAPADLFLAANVEAIDMLVSRGSLVDSTREVYAIGRLAVIARCVRGECARMPLADLASDSVRTIAIADPSHAPYGRAAQQALQSAGLWATVQPRLVLGANISQAELFVSSGNADAGIVALSLLRGQTERVYTVVDTQLHKPLVQELAVVARSTRKDAAHAFIDYLQSPAGRAVMDRYGFP